MTLEIFSILYDPLRTVYFSLLIFLHLKWGETLSFDSIIYISSIDLNIYISIRITILIHSMFNSPTLELRQTLKPTNFPL